MKYLPFYIIIVLDWTTNTFVHAVLPARVYISPTSVWDMYTSES